MLRRRPLVADQVTPAPAACRAAVSGPADRQKSHPVSWRITPAPQPSGRSGRDDEVAVIHQDQPSCPRTASDQSMSRRRSSGRSNLATPKQATSAGCLLGGVFECRKNGGVERPTHGAGIH